jgi:hypothetical protein
VTLLDALDETAASLGDVERVTTASATTWRTRGAAFATFEDDAAEFLLSSAVARAALETPDTGTSSRGRDWVRFKPAELDRFALDRATAWFASAFRRAVDAPEP